MNHNVTMFYTGCSGYVHSGERGGSMKYVFPPRKRRPFEWLMWAIDAIENRYRDVPMDMR